MILDHPLTEDELDKLLTSSQWVKLGMRDVEIVCLCGNELKGTVLKGIPLNLTCAKCEANFIELQGSDQLYMIKDNIMAEYNLLGD